MALDWNGLSSFNIINNKGKKTGEERQINDGVDKTYDIAMDDYNELEKGFNLDNSENKDQYFNFFGRLGLGTKGYMAALAARDLEGSTAYAKNAKIGSFAAGDYKCNKFVYDVLRQAGVIGVYPAGNPPLAGKYANYADPITGLKSLGEINSNSIMLGDVIAGHNTGYRYATGHVEIVTRIYFETNIFSTTGAHDDSVYSSFKGWEIYNKSNGFDYFNIRRAK